MPHDEVMAHVRYFAKHCLPEIKSWKSAPPTIGEPLKHAA
jgi:hypothetical protein